MVATGGLGLAERYAPSFKEGFEVQDDFVTTMEACGYRVKKASDWEDRAAHIDFHVWIEGRWRGIDVKGRKRLSRGGPVQNTYTCLELHGAHASNRGWLYGGKAELIAFEQEDSYLLVWRERLIDIVEFRVSNEVVATSREARYKVYSRRDSEEITWVETSLLRHEWVLFTSVKKERVE